MIQRKLDTSYRHGKGASDGDNDELTSQYATVRSCSIHTTYPYITEVRGVESPVPLQTTRPGINVKEGRKFQAFSSSLHYSDSD